MLFTVHICVVLCKIECFYHEMSLTCVFCLLTPMQCSIVVGMVVKLVCNILAV